MSEPTETTNAAPKADPVAASPDGDSIVDLRFLFLKLRRWSWLILLFVAIGAGKGIVNLHNFSPAFVAKMVVAPSQSAGQPMMVGSGMRSIGLVGLLPGVTVATSGSATRFERMVHVASTISLARRIDEKYGLMKTVFAGSWDAETETWRRPGGRKFEWRQRINKYLNFPLWSEPTLENLAAYLGGSFVVKVVPDTLFREISFKHSNPQQALKLLKMVYMEAMKLVREQDREQLKKERKYLDGRLRQTSVIEFREALMGVFVDQERRAMMLQGDLPSVANMVEPPYVSKHKTAPNMLSLLILPTMMAFGLSILLIVLIMLIRYE